MYTLFDHHMKEATEMTEVTMHSLHVNGIASYMANME